MAAEIDGTYCRITRGGQEVGILGIAYGERKAAATALEGAGFGCACDDELDFKAECTEDDHEVCDVSVALIYAGEIAADTGTAAPEITALQDAGHGTTAQVRAAVEALRDRLPAGSDARLEAEHLVGDLTPKGA